MSCAILNTMKPRVNEARTDISGERVLSYIDGVVNIEKEGRRRCGWGSNNFFQVYERLHEDRYLLCSQSAIVK